MNSLKKQKTRLNISVELAFGVISALSFILVLNRSDIAIEYMKKGLKLCVANVIPSLFPFMVISDLIVSSGVGIIISKLFEKPMKFIFGVGEAGACAYILGSLCGFPIGAKTAISMYDNGSISKRELTRIMTFCNNPGSAFIICAVGVSLFSSREIGLVLYTCILLSSVTFGIIGNILFREKSTEKHNAVVLNKTRLGISMITSAIESSAYSMLIVCSYVAFFSALVGCIGSVLSALDIPELFTACVFSFFELSGGADAASLLENKTLAVILCAMAGSWSGLSVHFQIMTICQGRGISFKPYFIAKAVQSVISAVYTLISIKFIFPSAIDSINSAPSSNQVFYNISYSNPLLFGLILALIAPFAINYAKKILSHSKG